MNPAAHEVESKSGMARKDITAGSEKVLTFAVVEQNYALPIRCIKEIIEFCGVTRIPMVSDHLRGVINLRGSVVPVVDLGARLGFGVSEPNRRSCVVIVEVGEGDGGADIGVIVDAVNEVLDLALDDIEPAPVFGANIRTDFIAGMAKSKGRFVVILDTGKVLSVQELGELDLA